MKIFFFYLLAATAILGAIGTISIRRPVRALLALLLTMVSLAGLFTLLGAYFIAMVHIIVYAGAILVLFLFVIMLQGLSAEAVPFRERFSILHLTVAVFTGILLARVLTGVFSAETAELLSFHGTVEIVGQILFSDFILPFEMIAVLLLLGIFAAILLAKKEKGERV